MTIAQTDTTEGRPIAITIICVVMAIFLVLGLIGLIFASSALLVFGVGYFIYSIAMFAVSVACVYGLWMMKKWALYLYTAAFIVGQIVTYMVAGTISLIGLVIPLVILAVCWMYQARMT